MAYVALVNMFIKHVQADALSANTEYSYDSLSAIYRYVPKHVMIETYHAMYKICATGFVLHGGGERLARASILSKLYVLAFLPASSNHSVIIKSSSSSTRVLGARRPTKNRETRHLGARRPTQAQSTLRPQALGARRPTKRTEVLQLGSTSATQAQR